MEDCIPQRRRRTAAPSPGPTALVAFVRDLAACEDLEQAMELSVNVLRQLTGADGATFVLRDGSQCFYAREASIAPLWAGRRFPMEACISGWVMTHASAVLVPNIYTDDRIPLDAYESTFVRSMAMAPMGRAPAAGAVGAYWATPEQADAEALDLLQCVGDVLSLALCGLRLRAPAAKDAPAEEETSTPASPRGASACILMLEVDPGVRALMRANLEAAGHRVVEADGLENAVATARALRPRLLLLSVEPHAAAEAREAITRFKSLAPSAGILLTSTFPETLVDIGGAGAVLRKPFRKAELLAKVGEALEC